MPSGKPAVRSKTLAPPADIARTILFLRGQRVILDADLAVIYSVTTGRLNEAVKRNADRFPEDFMFRLSGVEHAALISQFAISKIGRGGRRSDREVLSQGPAPMAGGQVVFLKQGRIASGLLLGPILAQDLPTTALTTQATSWPLSRRGAILTRFGFDIPDRARRSRG